MKRNSNLFLTVIMIFLTCVCLFGLVNVYMKSKPPELIDFAQHKVTDIEKSDNGVILVHYSQMLSDETIEIESENKNHRIYKSEDESKLVLCGNWKHVYVSPDLWYKLA